MSIVRVQYAKTRAGTPLIGKWGVYSSAWFDTTTVVPTSTVQNLFARLFVGHPSTGPSGFQTMDAYVRTAGADALTVWTYSGGTLTRSGIYYPTPLTITGGSALSLPGQCAAAVGYRATVAGPRQRGRSRWWVGPISPMPSNITFDGSSGGGRLTTAGVNALANNAKDCLSALASNGWTLKVRSGAGLVSSFNTAEEIYVDDVIDVMRSRRSWQLYQKRIAL